MNQLSPVISRPGVAVRRLSVAVVSAAVLAAVAFVAVRPDLWMVERVELSGTHRASPAALRHLADIPNGTPLWNVDAAAVASALESHPWVREAVVTLEWPDRVHVAVEEHQIAALLLRDNHLYAVGRTGDVFIEPGHVDLDHPLVTGLDDEVVEQRRGLQSLVTPNALAILDGLDSRGLVPRSDVSEVAFSPTAGFTVHTRGARIALAHGELDRQLGRLSRLVSEGLDLSAAVYVDVAPRTVAIIRPL